MTGRSRARDRSRPAGGAPVSFLPWAALGGQWFDAASGTTGSPVSAWQARGGTATATQGTGANQPGAPASNVNLGNEMACAYDGTDIVVSGTAIDLSAGWTIVSVFRTGALRSWVGVARVSIGESTGTTGADGVVLYGDAAGGALIGSPDALSWYRLASGGTLLANTSFAFILSCSGTSASLVIERGVISGGSISWSTVTLSALTGTFAMPSATGCYLQPGGGWNYAGSRFVGDIALNAAVGRVLTAGETTQLKSYLAWRFAL